jgi:hypothetical protein
MLDAATAPRDDTPPKDDQSTETAQQPTAAHAYDPNDPPQTAPQPAADQATPAPTQKESEPEVTTEPDNAQLAAELLRRREERQRELEEIDAQLAAATNQQYRNTRDDVDGKLRTQFDLVLQKVFELTDPSTDEEYLKHLHDELADVFDNIMEMMDQSDQPQPPPGPDSNPAQPDPPQAPSAPAPDADSGDAQTPRISPVPDKAKAAPKGRPNKTTWKMKAKDLLDNMGTAPQPKPTTNGKK